jgi:hypothetical protein
MMFQNSNVQQGHKPSCRFPENLSTPHFSQLTVLSSGTDVVCRQTLLKKLSLLYFSSDCQVHSIHSCARFKLYITNNPTLLYLGQASVASKRLITLNDSSPSPPVVTERQIAGGLRGPFDTA